MCKEEQLGKNQSINAMENPQQDQASNLVKLMTLIFISSVIRILPKCLRKEVDDSKIRNLGLKIQGGQSMMLLLGAYFHRIMRHICIRSKSLHKSCICTKKKNH